MTNPDAMAVPPSNSPGLIRLRLPSQSSAHSAPPAHLPPDSSPKLLALEQSLRQLIQSLLETAIMVHDLEEGSGELLFEKMYVSCALGDGWLILFSDELTLYLQEVQRSSGNVTETIPEDVLAYVEDGLNPDKYTRRFVNMLMKDNQFVNGKIDAVQVFKK
jgi:mediator of RNA polymerase II transcription subunit 10